MTNFLFFIQPAAFWLFIVNFVALLGICAARLFIKNEATEKKRNYLYYCSLGVFTFLMAILGIIGLQMPDHAIWALVTEFGVGGTVIMGFFIYNTRQELWLQTPVKPVKAVKGRVAKAKSR